jgi:hypothetical protein
VLADRAAQRAAAHIVAGADLRGDRGRVGAAARAHAEEQLVGAVRDAHRLARELQQPAVLARVSDQDSADQPPAVVGEHEPRVHVAAQILIGDRARGVTARERIAQARDVDAEELQLRRQVRALEAARLVIEIQRQVAGQRPAMA